MNSETRIGWPYIEVTQHADSLPADFFLMDHIGGFRKDGSNQLFDLLSSQSRRFNITYHQILSPGVQHRYPGLNLKFSPEMQDSLNMRALSNYKQHPYINIQHFLCSFNGTPHVSRKLLVALLFKFGWFDLETCSKNFVFDTDTLDGHISYYTDEIQPRLVRKFFIGELSGSFFQQINSFDYARFDHISNIYALEHKLTTSFLHLVSETLATSYQPFVTEKFLYSVSTRGLFLAYAQPGWHDHLERYYGFKKYCRLFDYRFDTIQNPIERLLALMTMISKFSMLSSDDWKDLYLMESDTIEYNYDHYFSHGYLKFMQKHA